MTTFPKTEALAALLLAGNNPAGEILGPTARVELGRHERLQEIRATEGAKLAPFTTVGCSGACRRSGGILRGGFRNLTQLMSSPRLGRLAA